MIWSPLQIHRSSMKSASFHHHPFSRLAESTQTGHYCRDDWMPPITSLSASKNPPCGINKAWFNLKWMMWSLMSLGTMRGDIHLSLSQTFHLFVYTSPCYYFAAFSINERPVRICPTQNSAILFRRSKENCHIQLLWCLKNKNILIFPVYDQQ